VCPFIFGGFRAGLPVRPGMAQGTHRQSAEGRAERNSVYPTLQSDDPSFTTPADPSTGKREQTAGSFSGIESPKKP